jgi:hypothetical protein
MDYKALLKKYIRHVFDHEGVTFISSGTMPTEFTDAERTELEALEAEVEDEALRDGTRDGDGDRDRDVDG